MIDWLRPRAMLLAKAAARGEGSVCNVCVTSHAKAWQKKVVKKQDTKEGSKWRGKAVQWLRRLMQKLRQTKVLHRGCSKGQGMYGPGSS
jgi:hypothetical protein